MVVLGECYAEAIQIVNHRILQVTMPTPTLANRTLRCVPKACTVRRGGGPTLEAATSCAVLAAISWEQTISSSYFPV